MFKRLLERLKGKKKNYKVDLDLLYQGKRIGVFKLHVKAESKYKAKRMINDNVSVKVSQIWRVKSLKK